jgi:hypothetical protein
MDKEHVPVDDIEKYYGGILHGTDHALVEEHLLTCQYCADRLMAVQRFMLMVRAGQIRNQKVENHE